MGPIRSTYIEGSEEVKRREEERVGNNDKGKYIGIHKDTAVTGKLIGMREENL